MPVWKCWNYCFFFKWTKHVFYNIFFGYLFAAILMMWKVFWERQANSRAVSFSRETTGTDFNLAKKKAVTILSLSAPKKKWFVFVTAYFKKIAVCIILLSHHLVCMCVCSSRFALCTTLCNDCFYISSEINRIYEYWHNL